MLLPASLWGYGPQLCLMPLDPHLTRSPQPTRLLLCRLQLMADVPSSCDKKLTATGGESQTDYPNAAKKACRSVYVSAEAGK